jgi:hypothetical protein
LLLLLLVLLQAGWSECHRCCGIHCVEVAPQAQSSQGEYSAAGRPKGVGGLAVSDGGRLWVWGAVLWAVHCPPCAEAAGGQEQILTPAFVQYNWRMLYLTSEVHDPTKPSLATGSPVAVP